jgi:hypothetical protein
MEAAFAKLYVDSSAVVPRVLKKFTVPAAAGRE